jgi:large subunit ribosomal protein L15
MVKNMVERKRKKKNKLRGQRSHGKGNTKNKRGAGCRGGRGRAGSHKHKFSKYYSDFGVKRKLKAKQKRDSINVGEIDSKIEKWIEQKKAERKNDLVVIDGKKIGIQKITGRGIIKEKILVKNVKLSEKARTTIEDADGEIEEAEKESETGKEEENKE